MSKNGKKRTWNMRLLAFALTMILAISPLVSGTYAEASSVQTLDVGDYKGDRAVSEWIVPTETGKIFAGWYTDDTFSKVYTETDGNAVAKFVDEEVLTVKKQLPSAATSTDATMDIRFLTAIDSLMFKGVSFDITVPESGKEWTDIIETVAYSSMLAEENGSSTEKFAEDEFGTEDAQFFVAHSLKGIPKAAFGHTITVTPSWVTMDGTTVTGTALSFTINEALLEGSLFAEKVTIGERTEESAVQAWDISEIENNTLTGTSLTDGQVMWFKATGNATVAQMTVTRNDTSGTGRCSQPLAGIGVSDGTNYGHVGVRASGVIYNGNWIDGKIGKDVLATWSSSDNLSIELEIVLQNGEFHVYVDGLYATSIGISQVISGATADTKLAFSLVMSAFNEGTTEFEFSNIRFTTDATDVDKFLLAKAGFASEVTINGSTVTSALDKWDYSQVVNGTMRATSTLGSSEQPMYFAETGTTMLLSTTVTVTSDTAGDPMAGIWLHNGTSRAFLGVRGNSLLYSPAGASWNAWVSPATWSYSVLSPGWGGNASAKIDIALKDGIFYVYLDNLYNATYNLSDIMPNLATDAQLAFGLVAFTEGTRYLDMTFSDINFTTNANSVDKFLLSKAGFASEITVNGATVTSALDKWDYSQVGNGTMRATSTLGSSEQPMYFAETGTTMLLSTTVTVTSDTAGDPMAGIWLHNGTSRAFLGVRGNSLLYSPAGASWNAWVSPATWSYSVLSPGWGGNASVKIDIALKDGVFHVYLDNLYSITYNLSDIMPNLATDAQLAFGLMAFTEGTRYLDMTFSNITFTTDATAVDAFIAEKAATE